MLHGRRFGAALGQFLGRESGRAKLGLFCIGDAFSSQYFLLIDSIDIESSAFYVLCRQFHVGAGPLSMVMSAAGGLGSF